MKIQNMIAIYSQLLGKLDIEEEKANAAFKCRNEEAFDIHRGRFSILQERIELIKEQIKEVESQYDRLRNI